MAVADLSTWESTGTDPAQNLGHKWRGLKVLVPAPLIGPEPLDAGAPFTVGGMWKADLLGERCSVVSSHELVGIQSVWKLVVADPGADDIGEIRAHFAEPRTMEMIVGAHHTRMAGRPRQEHVPLPFDPDDFPVR